MKREIVPLLTILFATKQGCHTAVGAAGDQNDTTSATPACPLHCHNGGVCRLGEGDGSELHPIHSMYEPSDLAFLEASHAQLHSDAHCVCPTGFVGPTCAVALETCGAGEHFCFHGAPCRVGISDLGKEFFFCACSEAGAEGTDKFAGHMCQHESTALCGSRAVAAEGEGDGVVNSRQRARRGFCTNWGKCLDAGEDGEFAGCECEEEWEGLHCEYKKGTGPTSPRDEVQKLQKEQELQPEPSDRERRRGLAFVVVAVIVSVAGVALPVFGKMLYRRQQSAASMSGGSSGGDVDPDGSTIASRSEKEDAPVESLSHHSTGGDAIMA